VKGTHVIKQPLKKKTGQKGHSKQKLEETTKISEGGTGKRGLTAADAYTRDTVSQLTGNGYKLRGNEKWSCLLRNPRIGGKKQIPGLP